MPAKQTHEIDEHRSARPALQDPADREASQPHANAPTYSTSLLSGARLGGRGNATVQTTLMRQAQQTYGNRALQRWFTGQNQAPTRQGESRTVQRWLSSRSAVQRNGGTHNCGPACNHPVQRSASGGMGAPISIQRHSAYEHYLLGQVTPSKLKGIPEIRAVSDKRKELESLLIALTSAGATGPAVDKIRTNLEKVQAEFDKLRGDGKTTGVEHTILQEMDRLYKFKDDPEAFKGEETGTAKKVSGEWQVPYVKIPVKSDDEGAKAGQDSITVAYSEINTMPDFFGNPETIANTRKSKVLGLLQGVRQQSYVELGKLYKEMFGKNVDKLWSPLLDKDFKGAKGPTGQAVIGAAYELRKESEVDTETMPGKGEDKMMSERYFAALERNACHFAPYSWDAWQEYHEGALKDARDSFAAKGAGDKAKAKDLADKAMLKNAFGEHYLQDSFAGGHLIDKTRVMQTFLQWVNKDKDMGSTAKGKAQWAMLSTIGDQDLKSNPQALDDMMHRNKGGNKSVEDYTGKVGLKVKPEIEFMMWWRHKAFQKDSWKTIAPDEAASDPASPAKDAGTAKDLMQKLVEQKFAEKGTEGEGWKVWKRKTVYTLNQAMIDVLKTNKEGKGEGAYSANIAYAADKAGKAHDYKKEAHEFNLASYNLFLSNAYIQGATKYFHDKYCVEGVHVITAAGDDIGTIYGDSNMLKSGGQKGVEYSAETSKRSRESVFQVLESGQNPQGDMATDAIRKRFPAQVKPGPNDPPLDLKDWNAQKLFTEYDKGWLNPASSNKARAGYKFMEGGGISGGNAQAVAEMTKHDAGAF